MPTLHGFPENRLRSPQRCSPLEFSTSAPHRRAEKEDPGPECRKTEYVSFPSFSVFTNALVLLSCPSQKVHDLIIQSAPNRITLISPQNTPGRSLFPPQPALRAQTSSDCEPWEHSRSSSVGDIHWHLAKNGQEQAMLAMLATPEGSFSLPYDATMPCSRARAGMPGGFHHEMWADPNAGVNTAAAQRKRRGGRNGMVRVDLAFTDRSIRQLKISI